LRVQLPPEAALDAELFRRTFGDAVLVQLRNPAIGGEKLKQQTDLYGARLLHPPLKSWNYCEINRQRKRQEEQIVQQY
jgi:hypothetical protein